MALKNWGVTPLSSVKTELKYLLRALDISEGSDINWRPDTNEVDEVLVGETDFQNLRGLVFNNPNNWKQK